MTVPQFIAKLKEAQLAQLKARAQAQQGGPPSQQGGPPPQQGQSQQGQPQPIQPGPPNPAALAVAAFLRKQDLKPRTCILNDQRKEMFKGKLNLYILLMCQADQMI